MGKPLYLKFLAIARNFIPYAFFFQGFTALAIKLGPILPLFLVRRVMARLRRGKNLSRIWVHSRGFGSRWAVSGLTEKAFGPEAITEEREAEPQAAPRSAYAQTRFGECFTESDSRALIRNGTSSNDPSPHARCNPPNLESGLAPVEKRCSCHRFQLPSLDPPQPREE